MRHCLWFVTLHDVAKENMNPSCVKFILLYLVSPQDKFRENRPLLLYSMIIGQILYLSSLRMFLFLKTFEQYSFTFLFGTFM